MAEYKFDARIEAVIDLAGNNSDRAALRTVLIIIGKSSLQKRAELWSHFERRIGKRVRDIVPKLHRAFDLVEADKLNVKSDSFDARAYGLAREAERDASQPLTVDQSAAPVRQRQSGAGV